MNKDEHSSWGHINNMAFARFLIPKLIKEDKILYLDSDTLVISKLDKLFDQYNLTYLAACREPYVNNVYNSGVLLSDNKYFLEHTEIVSELLEQGKNPK